MVVIQKAVYLQCSNEAANRYDKMEINCTKLGNTNGIEFYGNLEENFYTFEILANIDTEKDIVFIEPSDDLNKFFKKEIIELMSQRGRKQVVFE